MHEIKTGPARATFWCGVLTAGKQSTAPTQARTVRGVYSASNAQGMPSDRKPGSRKRLPSP